MIIPKALNMDNNNTHYNIIQNKKRKNTWRCL